MTESPFSSDFFFLYINSGKTVNRSNLLGRYSDPIRCVDVILRENEFRTKKVKKVDEDVELIKLKLEKNYYN